MPELAAVAFAGIDCEEGPGALARGGQCLFVQGTSGAGFVSVDWDDNGGAWVLGAAGRGGILGEGFKAVEAEAARRGARWVGFTTKRGGLVRAAQSAGYVITGTRGAAWIMQKEL